MHDSPCFQLSDDDLHQIEQVMHLAPHGEMRLRALAIRLLHLGHTVDSAAVIAAVPPATIRRWRRAWRRGGLFSLNDPEAHRHNPDTFLARLTALQKISLNLTTLDTFDDVCCKAIEMGLAQLGFDRLGLFFVTDDPDRFITSFGTDEYGKLQDERQAEPVRWNDTAELNLAIAQQQDLIIRYDCKLFNEAGKIVGIGWHVMAALWDGNKIIGFLAADNLLNQNPLTDADIQLLRLYGLTIGYLCSVKRAAEALLKERNMLRGVMDSTLDTIYVKDTHSRIIMTNMVSSEDLLNNTPEKNRIGQTDFDYLPQHLAQRFYEEEQHLMRSGMPITNREEPGFDKEGNAITYLTTKVPLRDAQGAIIGLVGVSRDITDLKRTEEQNLRLMLEHDRVELMGQLVSNLSHDLKTPLSIIKTSLYLLERIDDPARQKVKLTTIKEQSERLEKLIQDVLTISRLDQTAKMMRAPVDMTTLIQDVEANLRPRAEAKYQTINLLLPTFLPPITGNEEDLWRLVANLLENAINYTPTNGQITVEAKSQVDGIMTIVRDNGLGIDKDHLPRIFDRFYRADSARSMQSGGTGLGLSIVKLITEQHGGQIKVESVVGSGTCFQVWLPTA